MAIVFRLSREMKISPGQVEKMDLYDAAVFWRKLKVEEEMEYIRELQHCQLVAVAVHNPEEYAKLLDRALEEMKVR